MYEKWCCHLSQLGRVGPFSPRHGTLVLMGLPGDSKRESSHKGYFGVKLQEGHGNCEAPFTFCEPWHRATDVTDRSPIREGKPWFERSWAQMRFARTVLRAKWARVLATPARPTARRAALGPSQARQACPATWIELCKKRWAKIVC